MATRAPRDDSPGPTPTATPPGGPGSVGPIASDSYESARDALAAIVSTLEAGGLPLEESLALWERGEALAAECERWLAGARERLERAPRSEPDRRDD